MPIDTSGMLARLSPIAPININPAAGGGGGSMARQNLKLMREKFEFEKQQHRDSMELDKLKASSALAAEQLKAEQAQLKAEQEAAAKKLELKRAGSAEFSKLAGSGDIEGARAMVPYLASVGQGVELLDEEAGMPRFRLFDLDDSGNEAMPLEQKSGSTEDAFAKALYFSQHRGGPGSEPTPGGFGIDADTYEALNEGQSINRLGPGLAPRVPDNVIDTPAIAASTRARLAPMLGSLTQAYPDAVGPDRDAYRRSAESTADAVMGSGLPALKALDQFKSLRGGADSIIGSQIEASAQQGRFEQTQQAAQERQGNTQHERGWKAAKEAAVVYNIEDMRTARKQTEEALRIITNKDDADDYMVGALISRRLGERGATTEQDIARVLGTAAMSFLDRIKNRLYKEAFGGLTWDQKNALAGVLKSTKEKDDGQFMEYLRELDEQASAPDADKDRAAGIREYVNVVVPRDIRDAYKAKKQSETAEKTGSFDQELDAQSRASGLDPAKVRAVIQPESGGNPAAVNPQSGASGLIQFLPKVAESLGTTVEEIRQMSAEEQLPLVMKYLKDRGIDAADTIGDYYMAIAAPAFIGKGDSAVVYEKGSKEWEQNPAWRPKDGGDITVGDIKRYGTKGGSKKTEPSKADADALDILNRSGY